MSKLSEQIRTMVWAFPTGDGRRSEVLRLADDVERLEETLAKSNCQTRRITPSGVEYKCSKLYGHTGQCDMK